MAELAIKGGLVATPKGMLRLDIGIDRGQVSTLAENVDAESVIEAEGCWVGPGLVDLHAHLREPGFEWKEDITSAALAAAAGGFTALLAMPNTNPPVDTGHVARYVAERGNQTGMVEIRSAGCVTLGRQGLALAHLDDLIGAGVSWFTDDGDAVWDSGVLRQAMEYLAERGCILAQHAEDPGLARGGHLHEGAVSSRLGVAGLPAAAEELVVARDLALVRLTGCRYHVQHVSTAGSVEMIRQAKAEGLPVTAEVTPHHLAFDDEEVATLRTDFKMYPPLRSAADVNVLRRALVEGVIDAVATDHAPHAAHEREVPFEEAPRGVIGLETAAAAVNTFVSLEPETFFERLSERPAALAGFAEQGRPVMVGNAAHLVVFDPHAEWRPEVFRSKSDNSPFRGRLLRGRVKATIFSGRISHLADVAAAIRPGRGSSP